MGFCVSLYSTTRPHKIYLYFVLDSKAARVVYYSGTPNGVAGDLENDTEEEKRKRQLIFLSEEHSEAKAEG